MTSTAPNVRPFLRFLTFQVGHALETRDVKQDTARDDPLLHVLDAQLRAAIRAHRRRKVPAVVQLAVVGDVAESVKMRERAPVIGELLRLHRDPHRRRLEQEHVQLERLGGIDRRVGDPVVGQRRRLASLDERHRLQPFLGRDEIERTKLVVIAPAPPVGEIRYPPFHLFDRGPGRVLCRLRNRGAFTAGVAGLRRGSRHLLRWSLVRCIRIGGCRCRATW